MTDMNKAVLERVLNALAARQGNLSARRGVESILCAYAEIALIVHAMRTAWASVDTGCRWMTLAIPRLRMDLVAVLSGARLWRETKAAVHRLAELSESAPDGDGVRVASEAWTAINQEASTFANACDLMAPTPPMPPDADLAQALREMVAQLSGETVDPSHMAALIVGAGDAGAPEALCADAHHALDEALIEQLSGPSKSALVDALLAAATWLEERTQDSEDAAAIALDVWERQQAQVTR